MSFYELPLVQKLDKSHLVFYNHIRLPVMPVRTKFIMRKYNCLWNPGRLCHRRNAEQVAADSSLNKGEIWICRRLFKTLSCVVTCSLSQRALQCVVVVFEAFELQKVFGSLAPLASGGKVGHLDGGGGAPHRRARQVFGCRLVMLIQTGTAGIGLHPG